jgi:uncharacterized phiE125 gp8 family phage protein
MIGSVTLVAAPSTEPVDLTEAKDHLRIDDTASDTWLTDKIAAARAHFEDVTGQLLVTQTIDWILDAFPLETLVLPRAPVASVTSIKHLDADGVEQTLDASKYRFAAGSNPPRRPGRITPAYNESWPTTRLVVDAVTVRLVVGYGAAAAVPGDIKLAILQLLGHWYENREATIAGAPIGRVPIALESLILRHKVPV